MRKYILFSIIFILLSLSSVYGQFLENYENSFKKIIKPNNPFIIKEVSDLRLVGLVFFYELDDTTSLGSVMIIFNDIGTDQDYDIILEIDLPDSILTYNEGKINKIIYITDKKMRRAVYFYPHIYSFDRFLGGRFNKEWFEEKILKFKMTKRGVD